MADVFLNLLDPLEARFSWGEKSQHEIDIARRDIVAEFSRYSVEQLEGLYRRVVLTRKFRTMPNVADLCAQMEDMLAARKEHEAAKAKRATFGPTSREGFLEQLEREDDDAKERARDWMRLHPLGQEALGEGWGRALLDAVAQRYARCAREGKPVQDWREIQPETLGCQSMGGLRYIEHLRQYHKSVLSPGLERAIIMKETLGPEYQDRLKAALQRFKRINA